jgi:hypothetical protein
LSRLIPLQNRISHTDVIACCWLRRLPNSFLKQAT